VPGQAAPSPVTRMRPTSAPSMAPRAAAISPGVSAPSWSASSPATSPMSSLRANTTWAFTTAPSSAYSPPQRPTSWAPASAGAARPGGAGLGGGEGDCDRRSGSRPFHLRPQLADEVARREPARGAVGGEAVEDLLGRGGVGEAGRAHLHGGRAGQEELDRVVG